ncbi:MAG: YfhO family protein [Eubacteriales bacterium]|nr:YfhO family protein [Eubacteriales bacterium]
MPVLLKSWNQRFKSSIQNNMLTLLSFGIPAGILLIGFFTRGVFPIADRNVLTIDLFHQYAPFMAELQDKFKTGGSLLFSWSGGLGVNFFALFAYYLSSPLNLLIILFPASYLTEAIMLLIVIKIGLSGACFHYFLKGVYKHSNYYMVAVSSLYALSSFSLAYYWNIMWLDGLFLMPLMLLGLVYLIRDKRFLLYTISLGLLIFSNYYIAFFACIFTAIYFFVCLFQYQSLSRPKLFFAAIGRTLLFTVIGAGLSAVLSLPTYFSLKLTSAAGDSIPSELTHYYDLFDYIGQHFMLTPPTIRDGMPNMYAGVVLLILIPLYFLSKHISVKTKFLHLGAMLALILSFNINILNFFWHGMHFPNQLPYRNSFVYIFLILTMAYPALLSLTSFSGRQIGGFALAAAGVVLLAQKLNETPIALQTIYVTLIFIAIYAAVLTLDRIRHISQHDLAVAVLFVVIAELMVNTFLTLHTIDLTESMSNREGYMDGVQVDQIREQLAEFEVNEEGGFYRAEVLPPKTINDPFMYQYPGVSIFASTMQTKPVKFFENLGFHSNSINSYKYEGSTLVLDSLFGIKYYIRRSGNQVYELLQPLSSTEQISVYKNPYALSFGVLGSDELNEWKSGASDPFSAQNRLFHILTGRDDVLKTLLVEAGELTNMSFTSSSNNHYGFKKGVSDKEATARLMIQNDRSQQVYLYFDVTANRAKHGYVMAGETKIEFNARRSTVVDLGHIDAGIPLECTVTFEEDSPETGRFELYACAIDQEIFEQGIEIMQSRSLVVDRFENTFVSGRLDASESGVLLLTTPYDEGWSIYIDDEEQSFTSLDDGLIILPVEAGSHLVEMRYSPPWFVTGLLISLGSLAMLIVCVLVSRWIRRRQVDIVQSGFRQPNQIRPVSIGQISEPDDPHDVAETELTENSGEPSSAAFSMDPEAEQGETAQD